MNMERIIFGDSRAIKITNDMKKGLNSFNEKKNNIDKLQTEINELENSRILKQNELNELNVNINNEDKKEAKETTKKIKALEKEIHKLDTNIKNTNNKLEKINKAELNGVVLKSVMEIGKESESTVENPTPQPTPESNIEMIPSVEVPVVNENVVDTTPSIESEKENVSAFEPTPEPIENNEEPNDLAKELDFDIEPIEEEPINIPVIENDIKPDDVQSENINPSYNFLSQEDLDKMWKGLNEKVKEPIEEEPIVIDSKEENNGETEKPLVKEAEENKEEIAEIPEESEEEPQIVDMKDEEIKEHEVEVENEIEKPDIFAEGSKFYQIASKEVTQKPLLDEEKNKDLIPYNDYNDYVFKFGQNHYNKEALTPTEISDLSNVDGFLNEESFTLKRSGQYKEVVEENNRLRDKIVKTDEDYKKQVKDLTDEHKSVLDELDKLIDTANDRINAYKARISELEKLNKSLTDTVNEQDATIESLNSQNNGLQDTIVNLNEKITNLEDIKENQSNKISDYENKFKEVLTIVKEVKDSDK